MRDYALLLAEELLKSHGIQTAFVAANSSGNSKCREYEKWQVKNIASRTPEELMQAIRHLSSGRAVPNVVLHYSNYGYETRGTPFWLFAGLKELRKIIPTMRLKTVFHELYAMGWPWQSSFWLSPIQRSLAKRVARLSDSIITSLPLYGRILESWGLPREKLTVRAVFSTVGEIVSPIPLGQRKRQLIVFGSSGLKRRLYLEAGADLANWMERLDIEGVVDIGAVASVEAKIVRGMRIHEMGVIPASQVSGILAESYAGAIAYPPGVLGKSTIFAAYCSHGVLPLVFAKKSVGPEEVESGKHYILAGDPKVGANESYHYEEIAGASYSWYQGHNLAQLASHVVKAMK